MEKDLMKYDGMSFPFLPLAVTDNHNPTFNISPIALAIILLVNIFGKKKESKKNI
jgi:hypothetical protein